ncbi:MAG TPA: rRNA adenine N-6-methyltransferase family protein, partial [Bacteroidales bacterium]|nr:rRNA adenine N-6-methyltransferase family protein [Bacteroidales bacterium]
PPKVQSGVIRLVRNDRTALDCPEDLYLKVIKTAFNQRRKMLSNSLKPLLADHFQDGSGISAIDGLHRRPEQLSVEDFIVLTQQIAAL